ncbi:MAG: hypothetical protein RR598_07960 [Anaerorhabdus sp.]
MKTTLIMITLIVTLGLSANTYAIQKESEIIIKPCIYEVDGSLSKESPIPCVSKTRIHEYGPG